MDEKDKSIWTIVKEILDDGRITVEDIPRFCEIIMTFFHVDTNNKDNK